MVPTWLVLIEENEPISFVINCLGSRIQMYIVHKQYEKDILSFKLISDFCFSCKWVGLFVILWAGITTVMDLWELLGNLSLSLVSNRLLLLILFAPYPGQIMIIESCNLIGSVSR